MADPAREEGATAARAYRLPAVLLGIGPGGFFDGIVLHQILQWHHMVSHLYPPDNLAILQLNTTLGGFFHAVTWLVTLLGAHSCGGAWPRPGGGPLDECSSVVCSPGGAASTWSRARSTTRSWGFTTCARRAMRSSMTSAS